MATVKCEQCGKEVSEDKAIKEDHQGRSYYFCSEECKEKLIQEKFDFSRSQ